MTVMIRFLEDDFPLRKGEVRAVNEATAERLIASGLVETAGYEFSYGIAPKTRDMIPSFKVGVSPARPDRDERQNYKRKWR
jgi:hypothetical protein